MAVHAVISLPDQETGDADPAAEGNALIASVFLAAGLILLVLGTRRLLRRFRRGTDPGLPEA